MAIYWQLNFFVSAWVRRAGMDIRAVMIDENYYEPRRVEIPSLNQKFSATWASFRCNNWYRLATKYKSPLRMQSLRNKFRFIVRY